MQSSSKQPCSAGPNLRIIVAVKRWEHHTASGGYDSLARALNAEIVHRPTNRSILRRIAGFVWRNTSHPKPYLLDYRYEDWLAEIHVLWRSWYRSPDVVHVLYGDEQLDLLLRRRRLLPCPLIATFHLPPYRVRERFEKIQKHLLSGIDLAVVVGMNQVPDFARWLGPDRVIYVPHGIDTDRFRPGERLPSQETVRLLTVGHHMRDWESLDAIIARCSARNMAVRFDVVSSEHQLIHSANLPGVRFYNQIPEEQLIQLYRGADALLLPLHEATANNSVLEALACGTPVISTSVGGIPDYVDTSCGWLFEKSEIDRVVNLIGEICCCREMVRSRRSAARNKALTFSWKRIAAKMNAVYDAAVAHRCSVADKPECA